ncbi:MAG: hypothetical protein U1C46_10130 [Bacteroidales bacterium]|nr:hypothetical protein [Bacteroidales bacterium]MDZ4205160.1 hypothetical protein [Bacteroidales bacterium]
MSQDIIKSEIDELFITMREQWEIIKSYEDKIPYIELDILIENVRKFYEDIYLIDKMNKAPGFDTMHIRQKITRESAIPFKATRPAEPEKNNTTAPFIVAPVATPDFEGIQDAVPLPGGVQESDVENISEFPTESFDTPVISAPNNEVAEQTTAVFHTKSTEKIVDEPDLHQAEQQEVPIQKDLEQSHPSDLFGGLPPQTVADKYRDERKTINEKLNETNGDSSLGKMMQFSQISDLKTTIGINDKFLFINELFKGDLAGYNNAINRLNACSNRNEAINLIEQMGHQFKWNLQSTSIMRLNHFIKRRFTS